MYTCSAIPVGTRLMSTASKKRPRKSCRPRTDRAAATALGWRTAGASRDFVPFLCLAYSYFLHKVLTGVSSPAWSADLTFALTCLSLLSRSSFVSCLRIASHTDAPEALNCTRERIARTMYFIMMIETLLHGLGELSFLYPSMFQN